MNNRNANGIEIAIDYLNNIIKNPSIFDAPTWEKLEQVSSKSRATLWRNSLIYDLYVEAKETKKVWSQKVSRHSKGYRRTLEEKITHLEHELAIANKIADAHIRNYIIICRNIEKLNIDPSILLTDIPIKDASEISTCIFKPNNK